MSLIFGNPLGWWALLGWPALALIHCLHRKSRRVEVSTLFLLERRPVESRAGRRLERWRNSRLFWLQMLAVLLTAWLLSEPRWMEAATVQRIALVLDSSLSMEAFRAETLRGLDQDTATLARGAGRTEWLLLESDLARPPLYRGDDRAALLAALESWRPDLGRHDPAPALRAARSTISDDGLLFFVTDRAPADGALPPQTHALAYARPLENVGVAAAGVEIRDGQPLWRALVRNYGVTEQSRTWWLETGNQSSEPQKLTLPPGAITVLQGPFPSGADHLSFALEPDGFTADDRAPLVLPALKTLAVLTQGAPEWRQTIEPAVAKIIEATRPAANANQADLLFTGGATWSAPPAGSQVFFNEAVAANATVTRANPVNEPHPLMDGLNFNGLLYRAPPPFPLGPDDTPLLWDGTAPLIFLRAEKDGAQSLVFNLDPLAVNSSLTRQPAFALLVKRFADEVRRRKAAPERANFASGEPLHLALPPSAQGARLTVSAPGGAPPGELAAGAALTPPAAAQAKAPAVPAFFTLQVDGRTWLDGATQFSDPRESDFRDTTSIALDTGAQTAREQAHSHPDTLAPLWLLALLGALLAAWRESGET